MKSSEINILLVCSKYMPEYSGAGFRAHNLYKRLMKKYPRIRLSVLCGSETENSSAEYEYDGLKVKRVANKPYPALSTSLLRHFQISVNFRFEYREALRFMNGLKPVPDMIHVFGKNYVTVAALNFASAKKIPSLVELVCEMDTPYQYVPFPDRLFVSGGFPSVYKTVCISEKLQGTCLAHGIKQENIWCRPNPVNEEIFHPFEEKTRNEYRRKNSKFGSGDILIAYIAKFRPSKNHAFLIEMMKELPNEFKLFMKGPLVDGGPLEERDKKLYEGLGRKIKEYKLEERIELRSGFSDNIHELYGMADVYAFPSTQEGLGTPVLESLSCGVPVVANNIPGVTDTMIDDGKNGFICNLDYREFAEKIRAVSAFSMEQRKAEAEKVIRSAGTEVLDGKYFSIIEKLIN